MCVYVSVRNKTISKRSQNDLKNGLKNGLKTISKTVSKKVGLWFHKPPFRLHSPTFIESGYGDIRVPKCCFFLRK